MNKDMINLYKYALEQKYLIKIKEVNNGMYVLEVSNDPNNKLSGYLPHSTIEWFTIFELRPCPSQTIHKDPHILNARQFITPIKPLEYINITFSVTDEQYDAGVDDE